MWLRGKGSAQQIQSPEFYAQTQAVLSDEMDKTRKHTVSEKMDHAEHMHNRAEHNCLDPGNIYRYPQGISNGGLWRAETLSLKKMDFSDLERQLGR